MEHKAIRRFLLTILFMCSCCEWSSAYTVKGIIKNVSNCFYPRVYLEVINNINGIYSTNSENIIASANIDPTGNFVIAGNELPNDKRYYRLYVTDNAATKSSIYTGSKRNYFLLLLDNNANLDLHCDDLCQLNFTYTVNNSPENAAIASLQDITSGYHKIFAGRDSMSARKMEFVASRENEDYKHFSDTCRYPLVALLAVTEIGLKNNYSREAHFFTTFLGRLKNDVSGSLYAKQYAEELKLLDFKTGVARWAPAKDYILLGLLTCSVLLNLWFFFARKRKKDVASLPVSIEAADNEEKRNRGLVESLSIKEREILLLINSGLSNKEIAGNLNVEVSTVKTHVSNIYQKTCIKSRKEVAAIVRHM